MKSDRALLFIHQCYCVCRLMMWLILLIYYYQTCYNFNSLTNYTDITKQIYW